MDLERHERVVTLFREVLGHPEAERASLLDEACDGDAELRAEVEALLAEADASDGVTTRQLAAADMDARLDGLDGLDAAGAGAGATRELPKRIGDYEVIRCLGQGGMGVVYEAQQQQPRRRVAVKVLRAGHGDPSLVGRFRREAEILARLQHPGIAQVYEAAEDRPWGADGPAVHYLVMELVEGEPITAHAASHHLDVRARLELLARVCDAVHHAHERGVVHRDIKPANVLVDRDGQPRVLDFGIARALDSELTRHTATAQLVGTLPYMSPEQLGEDPRAVGTRSDVHALGVLSYEVLAGRHPHPIAGLSLAEAIRHVREVDPPSLVKLSEELAGDATAIVARAMEKEEQARYASAAEMAADIRRHLAHEPIRARRPSTTDRLVKFVKRNRELSAAVGALIAVLLVGVTVSTWLALREARHRHDAEKSAEESRRATYRAELAAALEALHAGNAKKARRHLEDAPESLRGWAWRHAWSRLDDSLASYELGFGDIREAVSAPGGRLVFASRFELAVFEMSGSPHVSRRLEADHFVLGLDGRGAILRRGPELFLHDLVGDEPRVTALGVGDDAVPLHDGRWLLLSTHEARLVGADGDLVQRFGPYSERIKKRNCLLSADGRWLIVGTELSLEVVDLTTGESRMLPSIGRGATTTPDSRYLIVAGGGVVKRLRMGSFAEEPWEDPIAFGSTAPPAVMRVDPRGERLLTVFRSGDAILWDLASGKRLGKVAHVAHRASAAWYSPDGALIVVPDTSGWLRAYDARDGREVGEPRVGHRAVPRGVLWMEDGERIASVDAAGTLRFFVRPGGADFHVLTGHESYVYDVAWSPDGQWVASVGWDTTSRRWDASTGRLLETFTTTYLTGYSVAVRPSVGRVLAAHRHFVMEWQLGATEPVAVLARGASVHDMAFDGSGRWVVFGEDGRCRLASGDDMARDAYLLDVGPDVRCHADVSGNGKTLAFAAGDRLSVHRVPDGSEIWRRERLPGSAERVRFDRSGRRIALVADTVLAIHDAATGNVIFEVDAPGDGLHDVDFHPDGKLLVTGSGDGAVRTWDLEKGELVAELPGHRDYVHSVAFSPDGEVLATGSGDATVRLWHTRSVSERLGDAALR